MSSLITSTNVNMMIFLLYFSFCCFQQCLYMETISASPTHHLSEILLSEHYRSGNSFVQVHLIQKRWDQNSDLSPASAHSIYITPYKEQFTFLHYLKKKENPRGKVTRLRYAGNQFLEIKGNCYHSKMQYFEGALKHSYLREHMADSSSPGFSQWGDCLLMNVIWMDDLKQQSGSILLM